MNFRSSSAIAVAAVIITLHDNANAQTVRNPILELNYDMLCRANATENNETSENIIIQEDGFWQVKRDYIIERMLRRYPVSLSYSKLRENTNTRINQLLTDAVAPCHDTMPNDFMTDKNKKKEMTEGSEDMASEKSTKKEDVQECDKDKIFQNDQDRFKDKDNELNFRRALLRLFHAAETGTNKKFVVIRQNWEDPDQTLNFEPSNYRPLSNAHIDDIIIDKFINDDNPPFKVLCQANDIIDRKSKNLTPAPKEVKHFSPEIILGSGVKSENAYLPTSRLGNIIEGFKNLSTEKAVLKYKDMDVKGKFILRRSSQEFAANPGASASLGITEGNGENIVLDAAAGYRLQLENNKANSKETYTLTPFISAAQSPTNVTIFSPSATDPLGTDQEQIAFALYSAGVRLDYEESSPTPSIEPSKDNNIVSRRGLSLSGRDKPGWKFGLIGEVFTDNFSEQQGLRIGGDVSLPKAFNVLGYRQREELLSKAKFATHEGGIRPQNPLGLSHLLAGWTFEWDGNFALDYLDFFGDNLPLNFATPDPFDRNTEAAEALLIGGGIEFELIKHNLFGGANGDGWLELSANWSYRDGFLGDETDAERFEGAVMISHPDVEGLTFGIEYQVGQDFRSLADTQNVTFNIGVRY